MNEAPRNSKYMVSEGAFSGPYFGDESPSNLSNSATSPRPLSQRKLETVDRSLLSEQNVYETPSMDYNKCYDSRISLQKNYSPEPMFMPSPLSSPIVCRAENRTDEHFFEHFQADDNLSLSPSARHTHSVKNVSDNSSSITRSSTETSLPLIDPVEPHLTYGRVLDDASSVAPELVAHLPSVILKNCEDSKTTDNTPSPEITADTEELESKQVYFEPFYTKLDLPPSSPPTSSPPQIFSSSPLASSQTSETSDPAPDENLRNVLNCVEPETFSENTNYNDRDPSSASLDNFRYSSSLEKLPPDLCDNSHLSTFTCSYFPRRATVARQHSSFLSEGYNHLGGAVRDQAYVTTKHITPQIRLPVSPPSLIPPTSNDSLVSMPFLPDPGDTLSALVASGGNIEEQSAPIDFDTSLQSSPISGSLPSSPPSGSVLSSSPLLTETDCIQHTIYPAAKTLTVDMGVTRSPDHKRLFLSIPTHPDPSQCSSFTEIRVIQDTERIPIDRVIAKDIRQSDATPLFESAMAPPQPTRETTQTLGKRKRDDIGVDKLTGISSTTAEVEQRIEQRSTDRILSPPSMGEGQDLKVTKTTNVQTKVSLPNPKRSTIASQKLQHKKLAKPFRSPVLKRPNLETPPQHIRVNDTGNPSLNLGHKHSEKISEEVKMPHPPTPLDTKKNHRTQRAASQFKSPLPQEASLRAASSSVRLTPTIQTLERKLQTLKRAIKVKNDEDEEALEALVKKWVEAGREVAWEVWELVKDNASSDDGDWDQRKGGTERRPFEESWGWEGKKYQTIFFEEEKERNWGWDVVPNRKRDDAGIESDEGRPLQNEEAKEGQDEGSEKKHDTFGTMLLQLGIAPDTLGWDEEEGKFVEG